MKQPKRTLALSTAEYRLALYGLLHFRNKLLQQGKICRSGERAFDEAAEGKEVPTWMIFLNA